MNGQTLLLIAAGAAVAYVAVRLFTGPAKTAPAAPGAGSVTSSQAAANRNRLWNQEMFTQPDFWI